MYSARGASNIALTAKLTDKFEVKVYLFWAIEPIDHDMSYDVSLALGLSRDLGSL